MKISSSVTNTIFGDVMWIVAALLLVDNVQGQSNATAAPTLTSTNVEIALNCGNERVTQYSGFAVTVGGKPPTSVAESTTSMVPLLQDDLDRPVCGGVTPGGKGYWFPVYAATSGDVETYGEVDLLFCTATETPLNMTVSVYGAPLTSGFDITNCEDTTCVAIGTKHPLQNEETFRFAQGEVCPNATNWGGVHFTASKDQIYFVHVDVTTNLTELEGLEVVSYVTESNSSSSFAASTSSWWITSVTTLFLFVRMTGVISE